MDTPAETLYWTLTQGQRLEIASRLGVRRTADSRRLNDRQCAILWLRRLRRSGSLADALRMAAKIHWHRLRAIEDALHRPDERDVYQLEQWRESQYRLLEQWRESQYRLLAFGAS